jgi:myo-inositol-1(or 4)-monophosphatase
MEDLGNAPATEKGPGDFVTQTDIRSQDCIQQIIHQSYPEHAFIGEELSNRREPGRRRSSDDSNGIDYCWIVDPLDGTLNFIHQLYSFSVSIGLKFRQQIIVGCVFDPMLDEMFVATRGGGAFLNGIPIHVSHITTLRKALLVCSFSSRVSRDGDELARFINILCDGRASIRRLGSAALNLCYVASGRLDGYWATSIRPWDVAAGSLVLTEAGGHLINIDGMAFSLDDPRLIAAASPQLGEEMASYLSLRNSG